MVSFGEKAKKKAGILNYCRSYVTTTVRMYVLQVDLITPPHAINGIFCIATIEPQPK